MRPLRLALIVALGYSAPFWLRVSICAQEAVNTTDSEKTAPTAFNSDFEVKLAAEKGILVRRKGTEEWLEVSKLNEPIAVGLLDSDHKIYLVTKAIKPPKIKHTQDPEYPGSGRMLSGECRVVLHLIVDDKGMVRSPTVDSSPSPEFAKAAIEAINKWRFEPAKLDSQPVAVLMRVEMQFKFS